MPITQDRLQRLALAADHFFHVTERIRITMKQQAILLSRGEITLEQAYSNLSLAIEYTSPDDMQHGIAYTEELLRYNLTHARNAKERVRMIRKRAREKILNSTISTAVNAAIAKPKPPPSIVHHVSDDDPADDFEVINPNDLPPVKSDDDLSNEEFYEVHFPLIKPLIDSGVLVESAIAQVRASRKSPPQE